MASRFGNPGILPVAIVVIAFASSVGKAQQPHHLLRGNMIPGQASQIRLMSSPAKVGQVQPVKVAGPQGVEVSVVDNGSFVATGQADYTVGMQLGSLYRFRITGVELASNFELYPSVELLDLLHPPEGLENDFPVPVVITKSDIREAIAGRLVTKVIYLEDPEVALPRGGVKSEQPYFDVSAVEDPIRTAEGLGRPMAILRLGSRVPTSEELSAPAMNAFSSASPKATTLMSQPGLRINPKYTMPAANAVPVTVPRSN